LTIRCLTTKPAAAHAAADNTKIARAAALPIFFHRIIKNSSLKFYRENYYWASTIATDQQTTLKNLLLTNLYSK
jgi:hypothetical protein